MKIFIKLFFAIIIIVTGTVYGGWTGAVIDQVISFQRIYQDSLDVNSASFCVGNNGELYVVYAQANLNANYYSELYFSKSVDGGRTWSGTAGDYIINANDGQSVYQSINKKYIDIDVDSEGRIFIVWCEDYDYSDIREIMVIYSTDDGDTWENSTADVPISYVSRVGLDANNPSIAVDPDDNLHVVWHQKSDLVYNRYEILYSRSTDHGLTWTGQTTDREISFRDALSAWDPDIDIDGRGDIFVVWNEDVESGSYDQLLFGKSTDGGITFSSQYADKTASLEFKETGNAAIHIDALNNIHIVYKGSFGDDPYSKMCLYTGSTDGGITWSGNSELTFIDYGPNGTINTWNPDITSTSKGALIAVYSSVNSITGYDDILASYSTDMGVTWSGNISPDLASFPDSITGSYVPYIMTGPGDTLHVIWREGIVSLSSEDLYYSRYDSLPLEGDVGWVSGIVCRAPFLTPVPDVHVFAEGTEINTYTDHNGQYFLADLIVGAYDVSFSKAGYSDTTMANVAVTSNDSTILDMIMTFTGYTYLPGDANMYYGSWPPAIINSDVTYIINFFRGCPTNFPCLISGFWAAADVNGDCNVIGSDVTRLINFFKGIDSLSWCSDYEPIWLTPDDIPEDPPEGWPGCE